MLAAALPKVARISATVRLRLSVTASTRTAVPRAVALIDHVVELGRVLLARPFAMRGR